MHVHTDNCAVAGDNCVTDCCAGEIQTTNGKSDAIANTVANAYTISLAVPP